MTRTVVHLDCDCFYAQVELLRLQLPLDTPLCVVQWGSALAVSYAARPFGIKRGDRVEDIRRKAGTAVTIVSVETMGAEVGETPCENPERLRVAGDTALKNSEKVSLARYRDASMAVFDVISSMIPSTCAFERASIDEVFLDVSAAVHGRLAKRSRENGRDAVDIELGLPNDTFVYGGNSISAGSLQDSSLFEGARFASELRESVYRECGYTMSAGIASNKMLAKYASALNKPGKQTIMLPSSVEELLSHVPITDFRGCGGKIGKAIQDMGFKTAAAARDSLSMKELVAAVGQRHAHFVYGVCRGLDDSQVIQRQKAKTLLAAKNFESSHDVDVAVWWLKMLARELVERMSYEEKQHNRYSRTLTCSYRLFSLASNGFTNISRTQTMPGANVKNRVDAIVELGRRELLKAIESGIDHRLPISFVSLTGSNFCERALGKLSITNFLAPVSVERVAAASKKHALPVQGEGSVSKRQRTCSDNALGESESRTGRGDISSYFAAPVPQDKPTIVSRTKEERDTLFAKRQQEAADLALARQLARESWAAPSRKKAPQRSVPSIFSRKPD